MLPTPWAATTGARTTTMAPVGPETWTLDPPMTAATSPATTAVMSPASAPTPELTPKARARGSATMPTVMPANKSVFQADRKSVVVAAGRQESRHASPGGAGCPLRA